METVLVYYVSLALFLSSFIDLRNSDELTYSSLPICQMKVEYVRYVFGIHPHMSHLSSVKVNQPWP